jgi:hypothetical protein
MHLTGARLAKQMAQFPADERVRKQGGQQLRQALVCPTRRVSRLE